MPSSFEWDEQKNQANVLKHGIDFKDAVRIFEKPTLDREDLRVSYGERRINSLGELDGIVILNVTHTERDGSIRMISARLANALERQLYAEFKSEGL